jgi:hypothetical protein
MFVGYDDQTKAFRFYLSDKRKVAISEDVTFDEDKLGLGYMASGEPVAQPDILGFSMPPDDYESGPDQDGMDSLRPNSEYGGETHTESTILDEPVGASQGELSADSEPPRLPFLLKPTPAQLPTPVPVQPNPPRYPTRNRKPTSRLGSG